MPDEEMTRVIEATDLLTEGEKATLMVLALAGEPRALAVVEELSRPAHVHDYAMSRYCGARVCDDCGDHQGLARCFCGWSRSGGNGRAELVEMGETIEPEDY